MTLDEAMAKIGQTDRCWLVWNSTTGEILDVVEINALADRKKVFSNLTELGQYNVPVATRMLESSKTTRVVLEELQAEANRVATRIRILTEWYAAPVDRLVTILERVEYAYPMKRDYDSRVIVDHLWELHRDELTDTVRRSLRTLVGSAALSSQASRNLDAYLLALENNHEPLVTLWKARHSENSDLFVLMDCLAQAEIADPSVINDLISVVETPAFMFEARRRAMMTLGRLDAARGTRAAEVIRKVVYDSTPQIIALRKRVLERLETQGAEWQHCTNCCYGHIHDPSTFRERPCPHCLGLGVLRCRSDRQ